MGVRDKAFTARILCIAIASAAYAASCFAEDILLKPIRVPPPSTEISLEDRLSADTELWWFEDDKPILKIFRNLSSAALTYKAKDATYTFQTLPPSLKPQADLIYKGRLGKGLIIAVSESLRDSLPKDLIARAYDELLRGPIRPYWIRFPSRDSFEAELNKHQVQGEARKALLSELYRLPSKQDGYYFIITKKVMSNLPHFWKQEILADFSLAKPAVSATLKITATDDLSEVAKKYAADRDFRPLEMYLRSQLQGSQEASIPFENILRPFIQEHLNQYADRDGPNCRNCALSANQNRSEAKERYLGDLATERKLFKEYRFVSPSEALRTGDVITYVDDNDSIIHAVNYLGEASLIDSKGVKGPKSSLVFTKNGLTRESPYIFSLNTDVDELYKPYGIKRLLVYRKAASPAEVISPTGKLPAGAKRPYYQELFSSKPSPSPSCAFSALTKALKRLIP